MDGWQVAQNYLGFAVLAGGLGGYYYYTTKRSQPAPAANRRRSTNDFKSKPDRRMSVKERDVGQSSAASEKEGKQSDASSSKKKKAPKKQQQQQQEKPKAEPTPEVVVQDDKPEKESDISMAQFAQGMTQARQGQKLSAPKSKENRVRTVKQSSARDAPGLSSESSQAGGETGAEADDDLSPAASPALNSGDVSDMLEPTRSGPASIRLTAPLNPQKQRAPKQAKEQVVESKKARQNRKKVEERRIEREAEEKERKALEEKQRRAAREARGEPAKNGVPVARAPVNNPWEEKNAAAAATVQTGASVNGVSNGALLDTFDAESTGSSTGGLENSTAATSTTEANPAQYENEDALMAKAMKESEDESGWTTVSVGKKQQKKRGDSSGEATPIEKPKISSPVKPTFNTNISKPTGFAALNADDPENWDA
ncbi:hypothetical protein Q7P37_001292 [Cladosporium fusiforme]